MATVRYDEVQPAAHINIDRPTAAKKPEILDLTTLETNLPSYTASIRFHRYESVHRILSALKKGANPSVRFIDPLQKVAALQEAMEILFYEDIVCDVLLESGFYSQFLQLHNQKLLVTIMAYDFQKHKFCQRPPSSNEDLPDAMRIVSEALWNYRIKLSATLARMRVASNAQSITQLLPPLKFAHFTSLVSVPVYARMTCVPASEGWTLAMAELQAIGVSFVQDVNQLKCCCKSTTFVTKDLLAFSPDCRSILYSSGLRDGPISSICPQDYTSYINIVKLSSMLQTIGENEQDVIITNCDNGTIPGHIASYMKGRGKVIVFGATPVNIKPIEATLSAMNVNNVRLIPVSFPRVDPTDETFSNVALVFCNPPSSLTSVHHPVDFIMQEGDHYIAQLYKAQQINMATLLKEQTDHLMHALKFGQAKHVTYFTRSTVDVENRELVETVMRCHVSEIENNPEQQEFQVESSSGAEDKGFLCTFKHVPPKPAPAASDVIAQAILRGVLKPDGLMSSEYAVKKIPKKKSKKRIFSHHDGIPMTFAAQQKVVQRRHTIAEINKKPRPFI